MKSKAEILSDLRDAAEQYRDGATTITLSREAFAVLRDIVEAMDEAVNGTAQN